MRAVWKKVAEAGEGTPGPRCNHCVSVVRDTLYLFGGEEQPRIPIDNDVWAFDLASDHKWRKIPTATAPAPRLGHAQASTGTGFFVFGGRQGITMDEAPLNDLHFFDGEGWRELKPATEPPSPCAPPTPPPHPP